MHTRAAQPFFLSVLLHGAAVGLIVWVAWRVAAPMVEVPKDVFDVLPGEPVASSTRSESGPRSAPAVLPGSGSIVFKPLPIPEPRVAPSRPQEVETAPPVAVPALAPRVVPVVAPVRPAVPTTPSTTVAPTRETPRPTPAKSMTLAEYRKAHPTPAAPSSPSSKPVAAAASVAASAPASTVSANPPKRIDVTRVLEGAGTPGTATATAAPDGSTPEGLGSSASPGEGGDRDSFLARLIEKLREAHRKPEGMDDGLRASVSFVLHESGMISNVRIVKSSGDEAFDASVAAAFNRVTALGRPPAPLLGANLIVFRTLAD